MTTNEARTSSGLVTVGEVAAELRVGRQTVYRMIQDGRLPAARVGGLFRITEADLNAYKQRVGLATTPNDEN